MLQNLWSNITRQEQLVLRLRFVKQQTCGPCILHFFCHPKSDDLLSWVNEEGIRVSHTKSLVV